MICHERFYMRILIGHLSCLVITGYHASLGNLQTHQDFPRVSQYSGITCHCEFLSFVFSRTNAWETKSSSITITRVISRKLRGDFTCQPGFSRGACPAATKRYRPRGWRWNYRTHFGRDRSGRCRLGIAAESSCRLNSWPNIAIACSRGSKIRRRTDLGRWYLRAAKATATRENLKSVASRWVA